MVRTTSLKSPLQALILLIPLVLLASAGPLQAASNSPRPDDPTLAFMDGDSTLVREALDQGKVHALYYSGDFDPVIQVLEGFIKRNKTYSQSDSVFIAKHLAVVYSANPGTRERGKYFMYRLLELLPSAKLVDMYVSDEVDRIFDKVREEFMARQKAFGVDTSLIRLPERPATGRLDTSGDSSGAEPRKAKGKSKGTGKWLAWTLGGTTLVAAGAATVYYLSLEPDDRTVRVP